jgi:hypothetical protein
MGLGYGEILAMMDEDKEFLAFERWSTGKDERINAAISYYEQAKISWGRDFANMLGLNPTIGDVDQGVEGTVFNFVSGVADIAGDVAFDPLTYIAAPLKAWQGARYGVMSMLSAEHGSLTAAQKAFQAASFGKAKFGIEAAFSSRRVQQTFESITPLIKDLATKKLTPAEQLTRRIQIQEIVPQFDETVVNEMVASKVFDLDGAKNWFRNQESIQKIFRGDAGTMQFILPRASVMQEKRKQLAQTAMAIFTRKPKPTIAAIDDLVESLTKQQSIYDTGAADQIRTFGKRHASMVERAMFGAGKAGEKALIDRTVFVGGVDELGRDLAVKSADSIYTLARVFMGKRESRIVASMYVNAKDAGIRRNIVSGLYKSMADAAGVDYKTYGKTAWERFMQSWEQGVYGEKTLITDELRSSGIFGTGAGATYDPSIVNGKQMALSDNQISTQAVLPDLMGFANLIQKKTYARGISNTLNSQFITKATDFWSAMNLLPRLGLRSIIDENAFHLLTVPIAMLPRVIDGYRSSIITRVVRKHPVYTRLGQKKDLSGITVRIPSMDQKDIGIFARVFRPAFVNKTDAELVIAQSSIKQEAKFVEESLSQYAYGNIVLAKANPQRAGYIADHVRFGYARTTDDFSNGVTQNQTVGVSSTKLNVFQGSDEMLNYNIPAIQAELGIEYAPIPTILYSGTPEFKVNYLIQLNNRVDRNGTVGELAVKYMEDPKRAIQEISQFLKDNPQYWSKYERAGSQTVEQGATDMYLHVRNVFVDDAGNLNKDLLDKVRYIDDQGELVISARNLEFKDIEELGERTPLQMFGYSPRVPQVKDLEGLISGILDRGFQIADRQIATLSREPIFYAYLTKYRDDLAVFEKEWIKKLQADGMSERVAVETAKRRYAFMANDMALNRMMGFIDNPATRSNAAFNARNVARYYRATEDFYRRAMRVVKNHPEALVRLRMATEGLDHAGFIHEDDNGEKYFTIPVDEIMYQAYRPFLAALTGEEPKMPMPMTFTGKIKMLAPSFDPEAAMPTFSSPLMSVSWTAISKLIPPEYSATATRVLMGPYAEGRDLGDAITPSAISKFLEYSSAALGHDSEQIASATMKAAAMYTANGMGLDEKSTIAEREMFAKDVQATARNIVAVRNLLGIFSPVTPGFMENEDIPTELLNQGVTSFRTEFQNLVEAEVAKGSDNPYDEAIRKWTRIHPGKLVYTVSESETDKVTTIKKTKEAVGWVQANKKFVDEHPEGSLFLVPLVDGYDVSAYAYLKREGFVKRKELDTYFEDIANLWAENQYEDIKQNWAKRISAEPTESGRYSLSVQMKEDLDRFLADKEYLKLKFEGLNGNRQFKLNALTDVRAMLAAGVPEDSHGTAAKLSEMIAEYDKAESLISSLGGLSDNDISYRQRVRALAASRIAGIAGVNQNAVLFYENVLKRLLEQ